MFKNNEIGVTGIEVIDSSVLHITAKGDKIDKIDKEEIIDQEDKNNDEKKEEKVILTDKSEKRKSNLKTSNKSQSPQIKYVQIQQSIEQSNKAYDEGDQIEEEL